jgi:DNA primase
VITQQSIEKVRNSASIVEVVSETVALRRSGSNFIGLCPFHSERSPSFFVREHSNSYHCFGCGSSGNVISFVMATRAMSFPDAVEMLASRFGIALEYEAGKSAAPRVNREHLFAICQVAQQFFRRSLLQVKTGQGEFAEVGKYLKKRALTADIINTFGIGYCPGQRGALLDVLKTSGFSEEDILLTGLIRRTARGDLYELFRGRLIFPVFIDAKRIAGFGGRMIPGVIESKGDRIIPKYINSPETPLYQKSKLFYGLPQALMSIRNEQHAYVVEGYMDVLGLAMRGVTNVIACCGTAMTEQHIKRLSGICNRVTLLFDGDDAGRAAASKSFLVSRNAETDISASFLPNGEDPDDFAKKHGQATRESLRILPSALLVDVYVEGILRKHGQTPGEPLGPNRLGKVCDEIVEGLRGVRHKVVLTTLLSRISRALKVDLRLLEELVSQKSDGPVMTSSRSTIGQQTGEGTGGEEKNKKKNQDSEGIARGPYSLPKLDIALLRVVMVMRSQVMSEVINNPEICEMLQPESLRFLLGLHEILDGCREENERIRESIRLYLQALSNEWRELWKEAHSMMESSPEEQREVYQRTLDGFKRERLVFLIKASQAEVVEAADNPEVQAEAFDRMKALKSQLDNLLRG